MAVPDDRVLKAAIELASHFSFGGGRDSYVTPEQRDRVAASYVEIIQGTSRPPS